MVFSIWLFFRFGVWDCIMFPELHGISGAALAVIIHVRVVLSGCIYVRMA